VDQGEQEYPPGTVGHLARGRGWTREDRPGTDDELDRDDLPDYDDEDDDEEHEGTTNGSRTVDDESSRVVWRRDPVEPEARPAARPDDTVPVTPSDDPAPAPLFRPSRWAAMAAEQARTRTGRPERAGEHPGDAPDDHRADQLDPPTDKLDPPTDKLDTAAGQFHTDEDDEPAAEDVPAEGLSAEDVPAGEVPSEELPEELPAAEPVRDGGLNGSARLPRERRSAAPRWIEPGAVAAEEAQRARVSELSGGGERDELASARLLRPNRRPPKRGWRHVLLVLTGGWINLGEGRLDQRERELTERVNQPLYGCHRIAMLSLKGGVGKTTVTATLGATFASLRGDRVIAVDANPDRGTLSQKIPLETTATVRHLLRDAQRVRRYTDVRAYTSQGPSRLEVLASEQDPAVSEAFSEQDYRRTVALLEHFYNLVLTDCGTGLMHSAMYGVLGLADALVIVSSGSIDGARSASATMDWLDAHGHGELVSNSVAVINSVRRSSGAVDLDRVAEHFAARCRAVVRIPYDGHLEEGAELDLDRLSQPTRIALLELAAVVADGFAKNPG
jgi:MinD-like ATPase involved in chromosome partitioning or flagellar assembly